VVEFSRSGQEKTRTRPRPEKKNWNTKMTFTGTLIEDLMATVERAEQRAQSDGAPVGEPLVTEAWFASVQEIADYDPKILGVA